MPAKIDFMPYIFDGSQGASGAKEPGSLKGATAPKEPRSQGAREPLECKKEGEAIICAVPQVTPEARTALELILSELESGNRPKSSEIAGKLEITTTALGRMLKPLGVRSHNTHLAGKSAKVYEPAMKARIKEILGKE